MNGSPDRPPTTGTPWPSSFLPAFVCVESSTEFLPLYSLVENGKGLLLCRYQVGLDTYIVAPDGGSNIPHLADLC